MSSITQLGSKTALPNSPEEAKLEYFTNPNPGLDYVVRFCCPEFTSLCPVTSQPDYATFYIDYIPNVKMVESKSLKLYLGSFRNHGAFHESCTMTIATKLKEVLEPKWLRISGFWYPRGGISIDIFYQTGQQPKDVWVPYPNIQPLKGRS